MKPKSILVYVVVCCGLVAVACGSGSETNEGSSNSGTISSSDAEAIFDKKCIALTVERLPLQLYSNDDAVQACLAVKMSLQEKGRFEGLTKKQANKLAAKNWSKVEGAAEVFRTQAQ